MGKRNDSIDFVTLYDVLNEAGLTERQVVLNLFISCELQFSISNSAWSGVILAPVICAHHVVRWINLFSLTIFMSLSMQSVESGVHQALILTK